MKANIFPGREDTPDWNRIDALGRNVLPARAYMIQQPDLATSRNSNAGNARYASPYVMLLNGSWSFNGYETISQLPEKITALRNSSTTTEVPSCWQQNGFYNNTHSELPFPLNPPYMTQDIPVAVYRRSLRIPIALGGLRKRLVFQGINSSFHAFINGREVGYSDSGGLPAEFEITNHLHDGDNEITVYVYGFSAASYLDCAPGPLLQGIFRDVYLEAMPAISIYDLSVHTTQLEAAQWRLEVEMSLISYRISTDSPRVRLILLSDDDILYETESRVILTPCEGTWEASSVQAASTAVFTVDLTGISPWTAETPELYQLYISVLDRRGQELGCVTQAIGFREINMLEQRLQLNGQPLRLFPVMWEGLHPEHGIALSLEDMIADIRQMKLHNINTVIVGPLPPDPIFLELCAIYGLYVIEQLPVAFPVEQQNLKLQDDPELRDACLSRTERLIKRDRNQPCVITWSMAGCDQAGLNHREMQQLALARDHTRPALLNLPDPFLDKGSGFSARESVLSCEDNIDNFWQAIRRRPWHDRAFEPEDVTANWFAEGLVNASHQPYTALKELAQLYQPVRVEPVDPENGALILINRRSFVNTNDLSARFIVLRDGLEILAAELDVLRIEPASRRFIELPFGDQRFDDGSEYLLRLEFEQAEDTLYAPAGQTIGFSEFKLSQPQVTLPRQLTTPPAVRLRLERDRHLSIISGHRFYLVFNHINGTFEAYRSGEKEFFSNSVALNGAGLELGAGPQLLFWRAPTSADKRQRLRDWQKLGYDRLKQQIISVEADCDGHSAVIESVALMAANGCRPVFQTVFRQEIGERGGLDLFVSIEPLLENLPLPPRLGLRFFLRQEYNTATYYGSGPHGFLPDETYLEAFCRKSSTSQSTAIWRQPVAALAQASFCHQENGLRPDVRYLKLQNEEGFGLLLSGDDPFFFSARQCSLEDLQNTQTGTQLPQRAFQEIILDMKHLPDDENQVQPITFETFKFAFTMQPIVG